jgi:hypothetical protein
MRPGPLDKALIADADPARSPQLAARAAILTSPRFRESLASGLEQLLRPTPGQATSLRVHPRRSAVSANASELSELAELLRGPSLLYARGVALATQLVSDGTGPLYAGDGNALKHQLQQARSALAGSKPAGNYRRQLARGRGVG